MTPKTMVTVAETAGFCFGVNRAVKILEQKLDEGKKVCTLGPIIHNPQVIEDMQSKGVRIISDVSEVPEGYEVVIRAHGVTKEKLDFLKNACIFTITIIQYKLYFCSPLTSLLQLGLASQTISSPFQSTDNTIKHNYTTQG